MKHKLFKNLWIIATQIFHCMQIRELHLLSPFWWSVHAYRLGCHWMDFREIWFWRLFWKSL